MLKMFYIFQAPLPPLGKGTPPLSKSMKALPPLKRNPSLDKAKQSSIESGASGSPQLKKSSLLKEDSAAHSIINKRHEDVTSIDKDDRRASTSLESHYNENPSIYYAFLINY